MHTAVKIGIGVGAFLIVNRMLQLNKLAANVTVSLAKVRFHKVNLAGIEMAVTARVNNPANVSVTIVNPVVRLWNNKGIMIAESPATGQRFPIVANKQSEVGEIMLPVPWTSILSILGIQNIANLISLFGKDGTKGLLNSFNSPIAMTVIMQVDGMIIETPKTIINK